MGLSAYEGRPAPTSELPDATVTRAAAHYRWSTSESRTERCETCQTTFDARERHVRLTLRSKHSGDSEFRYFCREPCAEDWFDAADEN